MHRFIRAERANHPVATLCRVLGVSRAGFYAAEGRSPCQRALDDERILAAIRLIHSSSRATMESRASTPCSPAAASGSGESVSPA